MGDRRHLKPAEDAAAYLVPERALNKRAARIHWPKANAAASLTDRIIAPASPARFVQWVLGAGERIEPIRTELFTDKEAAVLYGKPRPVDKER